MGWSILKTRLVLPYSKGKAKFLILISLPNIIFQSVNLNYKSHNDYLKGIVAQMFATGCIQLDSKKPSRTLMIGLGGAGIPNFLGELEGNVRLLCSGPFAHINKVKWNLASNCLRGIGTGS
jgi:hypothetical protein